MPIQTARLSIHVGVDGYYHISLDTPEGTAKIKALGAAGEHVLVLEPKQAPKRKVSAKQNRKASIRQEDSIAAGIGGRRNPGSGALPGIRGDVSLPGIYRVEAKCTRNKTYRLDKAELSKIRGECIGLEVPLFVVDFLDPQTGGSPDRWVMLPFHHFQRMKYEPPYETSYHRRPPPTQ